MSRDAPPPLSLPDPLQIKMIRLPPRNFQVEAELQFVGSISLNLCCGICAPCDCCAPCDMLCRAPCHMLCRGVSLFCHYLFCDCWSQDDDDQVRDPAGPDWERALKSGPLRGLLADAQNIVRSTPPPPAQFCAGPFQFQMSLNQQWTPRANVALMPYGLRARVDAWTEEVTNEDGTHYVPIFMIRFFRGDPDVLQQLLQYDSALLPGVAVVVAQQPQFPLAGAGTATESPLQMQMQISHAGVSDLPASAMLMGLQTGASK